MKHPSLIRKARDDSGKTAEEICEAVGCTRPTLYRAEKGEACPKPPLERRLFRFYKGRVPLANIYDSEFAGEGCAAASLLSHVLASPLDPLEKRRQGPA